LKSTALTVLGSFLFTTVSAPFAQASIWEERRQFKTPQTTKTVAHAPGLRADMLVRPWGPSEELGSVIESWNAPQTAGLPQIIQIEDAHGVYGAQRNLASLLQWLSAEAPKSEPLTVFVEGAWGEVHPGWAAASLRDPQLRRQSAESLLRGGSITGEEYLTLVEGAEKLEIRGIEDEKVYLANLQTRSMLDAEKPRIAERLAESDRQLTQIKNKAYSWKLLQLDAAASKFDAQELKLKDYFAFLSQNAGPLPPSEYPALAQLRSLIEIENQISPQAIEEERRKLLDTLGEKLDRVALTQLAQYSLNYRLGKISARAYHESLVRLAEIQSVDCSKIRQYADYLRQYNDLNGRQVTEELSRLEGTLFERLTSGNPGLQELARVSQQVRIHRKFWSEKFSPDDWSRYASLQSSGKMGRLDSIEKFIQSQSEGSAPSAKSGKRNERGSRLSEPQAAFLQESYYRLAFKRNETMTDRVLANLKGKNSRVVVVAGGFHTAGMTEIWKAKGVSYTVLRPKLNRPPETLAVPKERSWDDLKKEYLEGLQGTPDLDPAQAARLSRIVGNELSFAGPVERGGKKYLFGRRWEGGQRINFLMEYAPGSAAEPVALQPPPQAEPHTVRPEPGTFAALSNPAVQLPRFLSVQLGGLLLPGYVLNQMTSDPRKIQAVLSPDQGAFNLGPMTGQHLSDTWGEYDYTLQVERDGKGRFVRGNAIQKVAKGIQEIKATQTASPAAVRATPAPNSALFLLTGSKAWGSLGVALEAAGLLFLAQYFYSSLIVLTLAGTTFALAPYLMIAKTLTKKNSSPT
jgi:hypothetical protein